MEIERKTTIKAKFNKEQVKVILIKHLMLMEQIDNVELENVSIKDITKTVVEQGGDVHDADYIQYFDGIELTIQI
jgi:hypothetical protein